MAPRAKKRRNSVISISSSPPRKFRVPIYISSDEDSPPTKKRASSSKLGGGKEIAKAPSSAIKRDDFPFPGLQSQKSLEPTQKEAQELAANKQYELFRSWVDAGIQIAIREIQGGLK